MLPCDSKCQFNRCREQMSTIQYVTFLFQIIAFDELKTDYKNPIDQCNSLNPVSALKYGREV